MFLSPIHPTTSPFTIVIPLWKWEILSLLALLAPSSLLINTTYAVISHSVMSSSWDLTDCSSSGSSVHEDSPGKNIGVGRLCLLQGIFPTQESNPGLPHCRWILYHLSHQGSPRIHEWVAIPSPGGLPNPGIKPRFPALQVDSLPSEPPGKP